MFALISFWQLFLVQSLWLCPLGFLNLWLWRNRRFRVSSITKRLCHVYSYVGESKQPANVLYIIILHHTDR